MTSTSDTAIRVLSLDAHTALGDIIARIEAASQRSPDLIHDIARLCAAGRFLIIATGDIALDGTLSLRLQASTPLSLALMEAGAYGSDYQVGSVA